jgi:putative multiple sugar transport system substrate-binding protein
MDSLLSGFYADKPIHGVLSPNDGIARAILTSAEQAGQELPVVTGLDAETESVVSVWEGKQWSTVAKPTDALVAKTVELIQALQQGQDLPEPTETVDNGATDVAVYALDPVVVTKDNAKEVFAEDPSRLDLLK